MKPSVLEQYRKALGAFYTPDKLAKILANWAIRSPKDRILDPCFGGCSFLNAAIQTLNSLGSNQPAKLVYGVDRDRSVLNFAREIINQGATKEQLINTDFLTLEPEFFKNKLFDVILSNPPYIRHHNLKGSRFRNAVLMSKNSLIEIPGRASYWAYFVVHSLRFLSDFGRLALILPGSLLHADYAKSLRIHLAKQFKSMVILLLQERVFRDTDEESIILLADGYRKPHKKVNIYSISDIGELEGVCDDLKEIKYNGHLLTSNDNWLKGIISNKCTNIYDKICVSNKTSYLGDCAKISIGTVTGANKYFLISKKQSENLEIPEKFLFPIVRRSSFLKGLLFSDNDWFELHSNEKIGTLILNTNSGKEIPAKVLNYISFGEINGISNRYKCKIRSPWHTVPICPPPDAFLQYMSAGRPKLVLNYSNVSCTNAIHVINWKRQFSKRMQCSIAISFLSTLTQLSAELEGRSYGGGVLKLEPSEASRLILALPENGFKNASKICRKIDTFLRSGKWSNVSELVDDIVLKEYLCITKSDIHCLRAQLVYLGHRRRGLRSKSQ